MLTALAFMRTLFPIFTIQALGWSNQEYSSVYAATSLAGGIIGMLAGGWLLDRFGNIRMLSIYLSLLIVLTAVLAFSEGRWNQSYFIEGYMVVFNTLFTFATIALFATAMQCCWKRISALQFTLFMAIYNLGQTAGAALIGPLRAQLSWPYTLLAFSVLAAVALVVIQFLDTRRHLVKVEVLEAKAVRPLSPDLLRRIALKPATCRARRWRRCPPARDSARARCGATGTATGRCASRRHARTRPSSGARAWRGCGSWARTG